MPAPDPSRRNSPRPKYASPLEDQWIAIKQSLKVLRREIRNAENTADTIIAEHLATNSAFSHGTLTPKLFEEHLTSIIKRAQIIETSLPRTEEKP